MGWFDSILYPIMVAVGWVMVQAHNVLLWIGMDPRSGWTWTLSIVALVLIVRVILIPLFVRQIKAQRGMQAVQPELKKLQRRYKGKTDPASRQAMQAEMQKIYKEHGTSPFASCVPLLAQSPIFFALFRVLFSMPLIAAGTYKRPNLGPITQDVAIDFNAGQIFGASLSDIFLQTDVVQTKVVAAVLIVAMSLTTMFTQKQLTMKNMAKPAADDGAPAGPLGDPQQMQKMMVYLFPVIFAISGVNLPIGVLIYWTTTNVWSLGQQWWVIRNSPTPGSEAWHKAEARKKAKAAKKAARLGTTLEDEEQVNPTDITDQFKPTGQRIQPKKSAPRSKRKRKK